ncbi:MAG: hypothetical protein N3F66_14255 [Spirochaetes bacterium]|nr:hypothetical protein [Spirochaetota bacterium]
MDALLSMLVDLSRTFLQDVADIPELSHLNTKLESTLAAIIADSNQSNALNALLHQYYSEIMTLYSRYPQSTFLDTLMHRIESLLQIAKTVDGKL